jgi:hypothetical protein
MIIHANVGHNFMKGNDILLEQLGKTLTEGRIQSFILNKKLVELINVTYLKFDVWIKIVLSEGETKVTLIENGFEKISAYGDEEYHYPITSIENNFPEFKSYIGRKLSAFKELAFNKNIEISTGLNLYFDNGINLIIYDEELPDLNMNSFIFENKIPIDSIEI